MDSVDAAREVGAGLLRPSAERTDVDGVPRSHLDAIAAVGLFGLVVPEEYGGLDATPAAQREVSEELAAADANSWFVWTQHHTPVRTIARGDNPALREAVLPLMARGALVAGTAFTHLRRPGPAQLVATPDDDGWRFTGSIAWLTSWGLADRFLIGAQHEDDVVWALVSMTEGDAIRRLPLPLAAMAATSTVRLELRDLAVAAEDVVLVEPVEQWRALDAARTADVNPAVFGVAREALDRLHADTVERGDAETAAVGERLRAELDGLRTRAGALAESGPGERLQERSDVRGRALAFGVRATHAFVACRGGRAMAVTDPAQRLARAAMFLLVQGQTGPARTATIEALAAGQ